MCGIAGYIGKKEALPIVFANLRKLEYRGYDSAGVAFFVNRGKNLDVRVIKKAGKIDVLEGAIKDETSWPATAAIAHSRWATHGVPNEPNAHPHFDCKKEIFLVHNGIIENYRELKEGLAQKGHRFRSQTDTEVIAHCIEEYGFQAALKKIKGAYALAVIFKKQPGTLYCARLGSPLVVGVGDGEYYLASDPTALAGIVKKVIYLKDHQHGTLSLDGLVIGPDKPKIEKLEISAEEAKKGNFPHFMLKEIFEGPEVIAATLRGRLDPAKGGVRLGGLEEVASRLRKLTQMEILACGTSYYAGLVGELLLEELSDLPVETILASEYRYRKNPVRPGTGALFISQSGETADTLAALRKAGANKFLTLGIVNVVGSSIARETDAGVYNQIGPEIGVASTKAFLSQLGVLTLIALYLSKNHALRRELVRELAGIPAKIGAVLKQGPRIQKLAARYAEHNNFLYLGRGYNYPTALEGALKIKEIAYVHAEGYAGGEMKHGPIAMVDARFPTIALATRNSVYDKMISNLQEIKARSGPVIAIATEGDDSIRKIADDVLYVPKTHEMLEPLINIVPLQLFAYYFGVSRGYDVDKPRNLAKSVTVE